MKKEQYAISRRSLLCAMLRDGTECVHRTGSMDSMLLTGGLKWPSFPRLTKMALINEGYSYLYFYATFYFFQ